MSLDINKLPEYDLDKKYTLPKMLEISEKPLSLSADAKCVIQPKFDGAQAIFIPTNKNGEVSYLPVTRKGNVIRRLVERCENLNLKDSPVIFTEYEPEPWSDSGKAKLSANLYTDKELDIGEKLIAFDQIDNESFFSGKMKATETRGRLEKLDGIKEDLKNSDLNIHVSSWKEMSYADALSESNESKRELDDGSTRCLVLGEWCEGGVIRHGFKAQKQKPTIDKDIAVLAAVKSKVGQIGWVAVDTKQPDEDGMMIVFGGVKEDNHTSMLNKVVEVKMLVVSGHKGAGNPTFERTREFEKEFECEEFVKSNRKMIYKFMKKYKVQDINKEQGLDI